jgi:hypothetical protein
MPNADLSTAPTEPSFASLLGGGEELGKDFSDSVTVNVEIPRLPPITVVSREGIIIQAKKKITHKDFTLGLIGHPLRLRIGYCQLKPNWTPSPRGANNLITEKSMDYT